MSSTKELRAHVEVVMTLSLEEALALELRLAGGNTTPTTAAIGRALNLQLAAAEKMLRKGAA